MQQLSEDEFDSRFTVVPDPVTGDTIRSSDQGLDRDSRNLWTIVEGDDGNNLYAVSGWHYVNRIGYILTEEAWEEESEAVWCEFGEAEDEASPDNA
ncbi:hypothetical protein [Arthrobacter bambusae]|uniref:Uncharacterized protein n=1 Tax=Arthrobacter bambusae TaxID=1338426 RepID=A0AAW8DDJ6_9MICC|nr:hypothetical protein [Arthrobacter bambusae]MDP9903149.1 hypothetical protein [Arthrobacter bambusae]MDQ0128857.1 hypothetical protein [Arthrobacter bambusae]MDQ0180198.1 hypothetical protein [Arthrobacter bambusae]